MARPFASTRYAPYVRVRSRPGPPHTATSTSIANARRMTFMAREHVREIARPLFESSAAQRSGGRPILPVTAAAPIRVRTLGTSMKIERRYFRSSRGRLLAIREMPSR